ncbi:hypothetical protein BH24ACT19_BH24ACT19_04700 [soil metagenome]
MLRPAAALILLLLTLGWAIGCTGMETSQTDRETDQWGETAQVTASTVPEETTTAPPEVDAPAYGYTYSQPSGNRIVEGEGDLPDSRPVDVELGGTPVWIVGAPFEDGTAWVAVLEDGRLEAFHLDGNDRVERLPIAPESLPAGAPPLLKVEDERLEVVTSDDASPLTHPVPRGENLLWVGEDGRVLVGSEQEELPEVGRSPADLEEAGRPVRALSDARIVSGTAGGPGVAVLSNPTDRYAHGVLGDELEAGSIMVLPGSSSEGGAYGRVEPKSGGVFEALAPLWFEPRPGGEDLLAVTESTPAEGTRVSVYRPDGRLAAAGPFIGEGMRWRHLLAAGPFGPGGEVELAATRTPHVGGVIEFYAPDFETGELEIVATVPGYSTHRIYSRNLDTARAGDLDGEGSWELLVPNQEYTELGAIRRAADGAEVAWELPVGGKLATNLASATDAGGHASVAVGREDGVLRIWP